MYYIAISSVGKFLVLAATDGLARCSVTSRFDEEQSDSGSAQS